MKTLLQAPAQEVSQARLQPTRLPALLLLLLVAGCDGKDPGESKVPPGPTPHAGASQTGAVSTEPVTAKADDSLPDTSKPDERATDAPVGEGGAGSQAPAHGGPVHAAGLSAHGGAAAGRGEAAGSRRPVWYVLSFEGAWVLDDPAQTPLSHGDPVPPGARVRLKSSEGGRPYMTLFDENNRIIRKRCDAKDCAGWTLPGTAPSDSTAAHLLRAAAETWRREQGRTHPLATRGVSLKEAVLELKGGKVDLAPVFETMDTARYFVRLKPAGGNPLAVAEYEWDRRNPPPPLEVKGLTPGLHQLDLMDGSDSYALESNLHAWVLIADGRRYAKHAAAFRKVVTLSAGWGGRGAEVETREAPARQVAEEGESPAPAVAATAGGRASEVSKEAGERRREEKAYRDQLELSRRSLLRAYLGRLAAGGGGRR